LHSLLLFVTKQNDRGDPIKKPIANQSLIFEMLKEMTTIPDLPLGEIGATPRNPDMGKKFDPNVTHKVSCRFVVTSLLQFCMTHAIALCFQYLPRPPTHFLKPPKDDPPALIYPIQPLPAAEPPS